MKGCVLDSSALFYGKDIPNDRECVVTPGVVQELRRHDMGVRLDLLLETRIRELSPSILTVRAVRDAAAKTGDSRRLSETDIEVLALAKEMGYQLITDDYSIQNLAKMIGVETVGMEQAGITQTVMWQAKCSGCGKVFTADVKTCDVCGSPTKMRAKGRKKPRRAAGSR